MSIPTSFSVDIVAKEVLKFEAVVEVLKVVEEKDNLFANFPIGATIQDGSKRKGSDVEQLSGSAEASRLQKKPNIWIICMCTTHLTFKK